MTQNDIFASLANGQTLQPGGSALAMVEWTALGTPSGEKPQIVAPLHIHHQDDEPWYVLEGTLGFKAGDRIVEVNAGEAMIVPRGTPHTYWNPKPATARYIIVMPSRIRTLIDEIHAMEQRDLEALKELFRRYESELLEWYEP